MNPKSIVFMASVASVSWQILHTRVIFEGPSMIVELKVIQRQVSP